MTATRPADTGATVSTDSPTEKELIVTETTLAAGDPPLGLDPTVSIGSPLDAFTVAETIMQMAPAGLGTLCASDRGIWASQTTGPLASLLLAASPQGNNRGMQWVLAAVDNIDYEQLDAPSLAQAATLCRHYPVLAFGMIRTLDMTARQRDWVTVSLREAITPWRPTPPQLRPTNIDNPTERN